MKFVRNVLKWASKNPISAYCITGAAAVIAGVTYIYRKSQTITVNMLQEYVVAHRPDEASYVKVGFDTKTNQLFIVFFDESDKVLGGKVLANPTIEKTLKKYLMEGPLIAKY